MKNILKLSFLKLILGLIAINCYGQTYLITNDKQIKPSVKDDIVNTSSEFQNVKTKVNLLNSATTQLRNDLNTEISNRQNADNQIVNNLNLLSNATTQLKTDIEQVSQNTSTTTLANTFALKSGDTFTGNVNVNGNLQVDGNFGVGIQGIWSGGDIYSLGTIEAVNGFKSNIQIPFKIADKTSYLDYNKLYIRGDIDIEGEYKINGQPLSMGTTYPLIFPNHFNLGDTDAYGRPRLWFYDENSILKLGGAVSDGDGIDKNSDGIVVIGNSVQDMARIKSDRFGLTSATDSSKYYFRADKSQLFYKDNSLNDIFRIDRNSKKITYKDGSEGDGKVLTSDANGVATWQSVSIGSGDNLGNHIATTTLNMSDNDIDNVVYIKRPYGETPIALVLGNLQNEYYDSISSGSYLALRSDMLEMSSVFVDENSYEKRAQITLDNINEDLSLYSSKYIKITSNLQGDSREIFMYDNNGLYLSSGNDIYLTAANLHLYGGNYLELGTQAIYGTNQNIEISNFSSINIRNNTYIGDGSSDYQVYVCSGGTFDGMLTITASQCSSAGGTAEGTKLFIKK